MRDFHATRQFQHLPEIQQLRDTQAETQGEHGDSPTQVVLSAFSSAVDRLERANKLSGAGSDAYQGWAANAAGFLDRYADFAVASERLTRLSRLPEGDLSAGDRAALARFERDRGTLSAELTRFVAATADFRKAVSGTGSGPLDSLFGALERTIVRMKEGLESGAFVDTNRGNPFPNSPQDGGVSVLSAERFRSAYHQLKDFVGGGERDAFESLALDVISGLTSDKRAGDLQRFDDILSHHLREVPVPGAHDRVQLGVLDSWAEPVEREANALREMLGRMDAIEREITTADMLPVPPRLIGAGDQSIRAYHLDQLNEARGLMRAQLRRIDDRLADYRLYRGTGFPDARDFGAIVDRHLNAHGARDVREYLPKGLAALDARDEFRTTAEPMLANPGRLSGEDREGLREKIGKLKAGLDDLNALDAFSHSIEFAMTGGKGWDAVSGDAQRLRDTPGAEAWMQFQSFLGRAREHLNDHITRYEQALSALARG